ncbi:hypothetical protein C8Q77DRAFT_221984 [Trametes polyzona]|nr:hypothetical protein C8Q77DRAFT_221984 [Trametes polyzona]
MSSALMDVPLIAGPQLLGFFLAWGLQGVPTVQTYLYHILFPDDGLVTKTLVYGTFVYEWAQIALITQTAFEINVYHFGDLNSLTDFHNTWFRTPIMCAIISAVVQWYFCWRILAFSRLKVLVGAMAVLVFVQMALGIAAGILLHVMHVSAVGPLPSVVTTVFIVWFTTSATVDVLIATCMTYCLLKSKSGIHRSDALVSRLVRLTIETGVLTAAFAILNAVLFAASPQTFKVYQCVALVLPKIYVNTLLANLNNRAVMRGIDDSNRLDELDGLQSLGIQLEPPASAAMEGLRRDTHRRTLYHIAARDGRASGEIAAIEFAPNLDDGSRSSTDKKPGSV